MGWPAAKRCTMDRRAKGIRAPEIGAAPVGMAPRLGGHHQLTPCLQRGHRRQARAIEIGLDTAKTTALALAAKNRSAAIQGRPGLEPRQQRGSAWGIQASGSWSVQTAQEPVAYQPFRAQDPTRSVPIANTVSGVPAPQPHFRHTWSARVFAARKSGPNQQAIDRFTAFGFRFRPERLSNAADPAESPQPWPVAESRELTSCRGAQTRNSALGETRKPGRDEPALDHSPLIPGI